MSKNDLRKAAVSRMEFEKCFPNFTVVKDVEEYMREYLLGKRKDNPTCGVPLHAETNDLVKALTRLIDYGLIPTNSQPGMIVDGIAQRFFLDLIVPIGFEDELEKHIAKKLSDLVLNYACCSDKVSLNSSVAVTRNSRDEVCTWACALPDDLEYIANACPEKLAQELKTKYCLITIIDPVWGRERYGLNFLLDFLSQ